MTFAGFVGICKSIGVIVSLIISLITFFTLVSKRPRAALRKIVREEATTANEKIEKKIETIEERLDSADETDLAILRNTITHIYFKYMDAKEIPYYEKENVLCLYKQYEKLGGNSYVHSVVDAIKSWKEIV